MIVADMITDDQIRELAAFGRHMADSDILSKCAYALKSPRNNEHVQECRAWCTGAYVSASSHPEWSIRHLPFGAFAVAEEVASFVLEEAAKWEHVEQVHDALVEVARKIRTADWTPDSRARDAERKVAT